MVRDGEFPVSALDGSRANQKPAQPPFLCRYGLCRCRGVRPIAPPHNLKRRVQDKAPMPSAFVCLAASFDCQVMTADQVVSVCGEAERWPATEVVGRDACRALLNQKRQRVSFLACGPNERAICPSRFNPKLRSQRRTCTASTPSQRVTFHTITRVVDF